MRGGGGGGVVQRKREGERFMGVKERAVVAQRIPTVSLFLEDFKHLISRQLKQRSERRKEEENNRLEGDGERGRTGLMVGDTALECCSGFNYRQRNSLFKYLEYR